MFWEWKFFDKTLVANQGNGRGTDGTRKPRPWEEGRKKEEGKILLLDPQDNDKGDIEDDGLEKGIEQRPKDTQKSPLILSRDFPAGKQPKKIYVPAEFIMDQSHSVSSFISFDPSGGAKLRLCRRGREPPLRVMPWKPMC